MDRRAIEALLREVKAGGVTPEAAAERLRVLPFEPLEGVLVDHHRALRNGVPEVVYGETKTADEISRIMAALVAGSGGALATRVDADKAVAVRDALPAAVYYPVARVLMVPRPAPDTPVGRGTVIVASAGTSDRPVAEEAALTLEFLGHEVDRVDDIGVAGLHRLVAHAERLRRAEVAIVAAGMEGALPSVVAGVIDRPIVAVPTSIGYGVGLGGFVAMLGMLASCSPGVTVVNIDNGFGAAAAAARINRRRDHE